jgi:hypothetical protein
MEDILSLFYRPLSTQAFQELIELQNLMQENPVSTEKDRWQYCWGDVYSAKAFYDQIHAHIQVPSVYAWLWKSSCMMKTKVFAWLLLSDRLNTKDLLKRRHWNVTEDYTCVLCHSHAYEDRVHLFFECKFSTRAWNYQQIEWSATEVDMQRILGHAKKHFGLPFFMEVLITACWNI